MRTIRCLLLNLFISLACTSAGQNLDFLNNKELSKLSQLNPAYTGVLNQFRILTSKGQDFILGFETRILGGKNYLGVDYSQQSLENAWAFDPYGRPGYDGVDIIRKGVRLSYARDAIQLGKLRLKLAADLRIYETSTNENLLPVSFYIDDFSGNRYVFDSSSIGDLNERLRTADLSFGASVLYKNLVFG